MATREQLIELAKSKGLSEADAAAKVDAFMAKKAPAATAPAPAPSKAPAAKPAPKPPPKAAPTPVMQMEDEYIRGTPPSTSRSARDHVVTADAPVTRSPPPPSVARSFTGMGDHRMREEEGRAGEDEALKAGYRGSTVIRMRHVLKKIKPDFAAQIDSATDDEVRRTYAALPTPAE